MNKHDPDLLKKWKDFDEVYFDFQNKLHTFWTAIDVREFCEEQGIESLLGIAASNYKTVVAHINSQKKGAA